MDTRSVPSPLSLLERFDMGVVHLDDERRVVGMNDFARRVLPVDQMQPFDRMVLSFHPERSRPKVEFLLDQAAMCPVASPPPMTMIINIPERVLLIKVSRTADARHTPTGYVLVFYDITEVVAADDAPACKPGTPLRRQLQKIPTASGQKIAFVNTEDVLRLQSDGHYTRVITAQSNQFCNLGLGDLEGRLDPDHFMRVHRSHIVNLRAVSQLLRTDGRLMLRLHGEDAEVPVSRTSSPALLARLGMLPTSMGR
ncbi:MAG: LytTR family transcriptional regulator DNA-binding domain-containing protein [Aquabacterium sp.]|nr:LytTR family transcriptional regulator DNA-binding domain-containing protein [Aquabacterium sp.]